MKIVPLALTKIIPNLQGISPFVFWLEIRTKKSLSGKLDNVHLYRGLNNILDIE